MVGFDPSPPPVKEWITLKVCAWAGGIAIVVIANTVVRTSTTIPARRLMSRIEAALCFEAAISFLLDRLRNHRCRSTKAKAIYDPAVALPARRGVTIALSSGPVNLISHYGARSSWQEVYRVTVSWFHTTKLRQALEVNRESW
jgi:hypothetical protein